MSAPVVSWLETFWPHPCDSDQTIWLLRRLAADRVLTPVVIETLATGGRTRYLVGTLPHKVAPLGHFLTSQVDHLTVQALNNNHPAVVSSATVRFHPNGLPLDAEASPNTARDVLVALASTRAGETLSVQMVLWHGIAPQIATRGQTWENATDWWVNALRSVVGLKPQSRDTNRAIEAGIANKVAQYGFVATFRIGVDAASSGRREQLALNLLGALGTATAPGVRLGYRHVPARRMAQPFVLSWWCPDRDQSRLSVEEIPGLMGLPIADKDDDLPGLPPSHPRLLPLPVQNQQNKQRVFAVSDAPATLDQPIGFSTRDNLTHLSITAPTGAGKSTLLWHLIDGDLNTGSGMVVIDPKGDLIQSVLSTIPKNRETDVVVLDPTDREHPVGFNPLRVGAGESADITADTITSTIIQLWSDTGVRTFDVLSAAIATLTKHNAALVCQGQLNTMTLLDVPRLIGDPTFQHRILRKLDDEVLAGFWAEFGAMSTAGRSEVVAPVMRRLRQFLAHPSLRAVLGQAEPAFSIADVFAPSRPKALLVPLNKALLGTQTAQLFGSLVVNQVWHETLLRARLPQTKRRPVSIIVDEAPDLLRLPLSIDDALAQARGYGVGFTLVAQFRRQWSTSLRDAVDANALSKICFRLPADDATHMSKLSGGDVAVEDFMNLDRYHIYASLATDGQPGDWFSARTLPPPQPVSNPEQIRRISREHYGQLVAEKSQRTDIPMDEDATETEQLGRRRRPR